MDKSSRIAVVGAGISGLALSITLKQAGFDNITIFERDTSFDSRRQGYGLTILQGKSALRSLGVLDQAKKYNAPSKAHYIFDSKGAILGFYGTLFWDHLNNNRSLRSVEKGLSMHIPRQALRRVLIQRYYSFSENQNQIKWNSILSSLQFNKASAVLRFKDVSFEADAVFGCDGIYSTVRRMVVIDEKPLNYLGVMVVLGLCKSDHQLNKNRIFQTADGQFRLFTMPFLPNTSQMGSMWQLSFKINLKQAISYSQNVEKLKQFILSRLSNWHSPIPQMIISTKLQNIMPIPAYDRDPIQPSLKDPRVFLLGDALHPMSPFKGQGANQALIDAVEVVSFLQNNKEDVNILQRLIHRASQKVMKSRERVQKYHQQQFVSIDNFIYPGIDQRLIGYLQQSNVSANSSDIENMILEVMRRHKYI